MNIDWSGEVRTAAVQPSKPAAAHPDIPLQVPQQVPQAWKLPDDPTIVNITDVVQEQQPTSRSHPDMLNRLPADVVDTPMTSGEAYRGSLNAMLSQNIGNYIVASFLVGTQGLVTWEGVLYEVGNNYLTIYQDSRDRYIVADIYSLKFIEFYDTQRRELCDRILRGEDWQLER